MTAASHLPASLGRLQRPALGAGAALGVLALLGALVAPDEFFQAYLMAYVFWLAVPLGSLAVLMLHHLAGGSWGYVIRRPLEAATRTLPLLAALFVPLLVGLPRLYSWAQPEAVAADALLQRKSSYLNVPFFVGRAALYFAIWMGLAWLLNKWSAEDEGSEMPLHARQFGMVSAPGILVYGLTVTFAAVDWVMSLEAHWFSTIYGMLFIVGQALAALAFAVVVLSRLARSEPLAPPSAGLAGRVQTREFHNLGNLLLAFVMLWAYISFSQFLIIWSGNLPEEIPWYLHRTGSGWQALALVLIVAHFAVPFVLLLLRGMKKRPETLATLAGALFLLRYVDLFWIAAPGFRTEGLRVHWLDPLVWAAVGGIWLGTFLWQLNKRPLLARHDPSLEGELEPAAEG